MEERHNAEYLKAFLAELETADMGDAISYYERWRTAQPEWHEGDTRCDRFHRGPTAEQYNEQEGLFA